MELTDEDAIIAFLTDEKGRAKLSKPQEAKLERLYFADDAMRLHGVREKVVAMLRNKFGVSKSTALNDYYSMQRVFGTSYKHDRSYHIDLVLAKIMDTRRKAEIKGDVKTMAACDANYAKAIKEFMGDKDVPDYSELQPPTILMTLDPKVLGTPVLPESELKMHIQRLKRVDKEARLPQFNPEAGELIDFLDIKEESDED